MASQIASLIVILLFASPLAWSQQPHISVPLPSQRSAESSISIARARVPRKARELYEVAQKTARKHDYLKAQKKLDQALHLYPAFPEALTMQGSIQMDLNQLESAEQSLQAAVRSDPSYGWPYLLLSSLYNRQGRFDNALAMAQWAAALMPDVWLVHYEMARAFMEKHQYALALNTSDAALRTNLGTLLHVAKADALIGLGRYQEAAEELRTYLQYQPAGEASQDAHDLLDKIQSAMGQ